MNNVDLIVVVGPMSSGVSAAVEAMVHQHGNDVIVVETSKTEVSIPIKNTYVAPLELEVVYDEVIKRDTFKNITFSKVKSSKLPARPFNKKFFNRKAIR